MDPSRSSTDALRACARFSEYLNTLLPHARDRPGEEEGSLLLRHLASSVLKVLGRPVSHWDLNKESLRRARELTGVLREARSDPVEVCARLNEEARSGCRRCSSEEEDEDDSSSEGVGAGLAVALYLNYCDATAGKEEEEEKEAAVDLVPSVYDPKHVLVKLFVFKNKKLFFPIQGGPIAHKLIERPQKHSRK